MITQSLADSALPGLISLRDGLGHSSYQGNPKSRQRFLMTVQKERDACEFGHVGFTQSCGCLIFSPRKSMEWASVTFGRLTAKCYYHCGFRLGNRGSLVLHCVQISSLLWNWTCPRAAEDLTEEFINFTYASYERSSSISKMLIALGLKVKKKRRLETTLL